MGVLQNEFDRVIKELCTVDSLKAMLVRAFRTHVGWNSRTN